MLLQKTTEGLFRDRHDGRVFLACVAAQRVGSEGVEIREGRGSQISIQKTVHAIQKCFMSTFCRVLVDQYSSEKAFLANLLMKDVASTGNHDFYHARENKVIPHFLFYLKCISGLLFSYLKIDYR